MSSKYQSFLKEEFHSKHIRAVFSSEFLLKFHFKEKFAHVLKFVGSVSSLAAMMCSRISANRIFHTVILFCCPGIERGRGEACVHLAAFYSAKAM